MNDIPCSGCGSPPPAPEPARKTQRLTLSQDPDVFEVRWAGSEVAPIGFRVNYKTRSVDFVY